VERLRRGGFGVLVAVLGALDPEDAEQLARLRHGATACVAVLVDTETWAPSSGRRTPEGQDRAAALLTGAGWRVLRCQHGTTLSSVWPQAGRRFLPTTPSTAQPA
jgi:hypothetical protein